MIKRVVLYSLPEGTDADKFWKYHTEVYANHFKKLAGTRLKKYVINRVRQVKHGEPGFWGLVEQWFTNEDAMKAVTEDCEKTKLPSGKTVAQDFISRVIPGCAVIMEEKAIVSDTSQGQGKLPKSIALNSLPKGTDPDKFWKFHTEVHALDFKKIAVPRLRKYVISRVVKVLCGEPHFFETIENLWESEEASNTAIEQSRHTKLPSGKTVAEDFRGWAILNSASWLEEKIIRL